MESYQLRVIAERDELDGRLEKLRTFAHGRTFVDVDRDEQRRLMRQMLIMSDYLDILDQRIAAFQEPHARPVVG